MGNDRWILNEEDDWDAVPEPAPREDPSDAPPTDALVGRDPDQAVAVYVNRAAEVLKVELAEDWRKSVDPRDLRSNVLAAANAATMQALAVQVDETDPAAQPASPAPGEGTQDDSRITPQDAMRLLDEVSADLAQFTRRLSAVEQVAHVESAGGNVRGSGQRGQVLDVQVDARWASSARNAEIENEILSFLLTLASRNSAGELADGPQSRAISELMDLAGDPQRLMRRVGLTS